MSSMRLHPYAILLGVVIGIVTLFTLRHPLFALMSGLIAVLGLDMILRVKQKDKTDIDPK